MPCVAIVAWGQGVYFLQGAWPESGGWLHFLSWQQPQALGISLGKTDLSLISLMDPYHQGLKRPSIVLLLVLFAFFVLPASTRIFRVRQSITLLWLCSSETRLSPHGPPRSFLKACSGSELLPGSSSPLPVRALVGKPSLCSLVGYRSIQLWNELFESWGGEELVF